jgi:hypothetical protein
MESHLKEENLELMHLQTKPTSDAQTMQNWQQIVTFEDAIHHYPGCKRMKQEYLNGFGKWAKSNT